MKPVRISAVSYLNTYPFVYGILQSGLMNDFILKLDVPSVCALNLKNGSSDIALVPVGAISDFEYLTFVSDYCIGAVGEVQTVLLLSKNPLPEIKKIHLDPDSRTSVLLAKILALHYWKISPEWENLNKWNGEQADYDAVVAIGDKTFSLRNEYPYQYDLAYEWIQFTSLPFVFAAWVSVKKQSDKVIEELNNALTFGIEHIHDTLLFFIEKLPTSMEDALAYLEQNISYKFDQKKKKGLEKFIQLAKTIK